MITAWDKNRLFKWIMDHGMTENEWEITFAYWLVPLLCSKQGQESRLPRTVFRGGFDISKNGDSMTSPGNLCQCSVTLTVPKGFSFHLNGIFCTLGGVYCLLACHWAALRIWLYSSLPHMRNLYTLIRSYLRFFFFSSCLSDSNRRGAPIS